MICPKTKFIKFPPKILKDNNEIMPLIFYINCFSLQLHINKNML